MALLRMLSFGPREVAAQPARALPAIEKAAPAPAVEKAPRESAPAPQTAFDGDWPAFVAKLNLTGMAGMLARHGEFASFENGRLELVVPEAQRMYADRPYTEKLQAELAPHLGKVRVVVRVGATAGASLAAVRQRESDERRESAAQALEGDPFVRELVRDFGAEIVSSSIKPTDGSHDNSSGRKG
jgi:DNA polymerase-3 subunit gamma/tau